MADNKKSRSLDNSYAHLQPQAIDIERIVLGALMIDKDAFSVVSETLHPETFYEPRNQKVYRAIQSLSLEENPVDIVLDCVGGTGLGKHLEKLAPGGRWILIATLGGESAEIALRPILKRGLRLIGSTLRSRTTEKKGEILAGLEKQIWPAMEAKTIRPVIFKTFPIREAEQAHAVLERGENIGKVVLSIRDEE